MFYYKNNTNCFCYLKKQKTGERQRAYSCTEPRAYPNLNPGLVYKQAMILCAIHYHRQPETW